jgi:hypothetical protein
VSCPTPYTPEANAAALAALVARSDGASFTLTLVSTNRPFFEHPMQRAVLPVTNTWTMIAWSARYKSQPFGDAISVDVGDEVLGTGLILQWAKLQFDRQAIRTAPLFPLAEPPERRWTGFNWVEVCSGKATG